MGNEKGIEEQKGSQKKMKEVDELKSIDQSNQMQIARSLALPVSSDHKCQDTGVTGVTFGGRLPLPS
jgi:NADH:ubiquinone oxidoreductase subunit D